jgi:uncharacterized damage-inducible protein DinB
MSIAQSLLPEFAHEADVTRKVLAAVPQDKFSWSPHEKSYSLGQLATHLANLPVWTMATIHQDSLDLNPKDGDPPKGREATTVEEVLAIYDENIAAAKDALAGASDETLTSSWTLRNGGEALFTMPKVAVLRSFVMNHQIHHRGQMSVYLRLAGAKVPSVYGPTADESPF